MSRFRPKQFAPPRSRAGRDQAVREALGLGPVTTTEMLKVLYPADNDRAPWALLAYRRGWLTFTEYALIPPTEMGPLERMFAAGPFTKFLRKRSW